MSDGAEIPVRQSELSRITNSEREIDGRTAYAMRHLSELSVVWWTNSVTGPGAYFESLSGKGVVKNV